MEIQSALYVGSMVGVFLFDKLILNRFYPRLRFQEWRLTANVIKFAFWPICIFRVAE